MNKPTVILDMRNLALRAYRTGKDPEGTLASDGETQVPSLPWALKNFLDLNASLFEEVPPRQIIACWDGGNDYRIGLYPGYKEKRRAASGTMLPELKKAQNEYLDTIKQFLRGLGVTQGVVDGVEADDLIAYLASKVDNPVIFSNDEDLLQLCHDTGAKVINGKADMIDADHAVDGIPVRFTRLKKSIVGDGTDEYRGVPDVGKVSMQKLLAEFGEDGLEELEAIVADTKWAELEEIAETSGSSALQLLFKHREQWAMFYNVASLHPELCEGVRDRKIVRIKWDKQVTSQAEISSVARSAGLDGIAQRFKRWYPEFRLADNTDEGKSNLKHFIQNLDDTPYVAFDYESYDSLEHPAFQEAKSGTSDYVDVLSQIPTGVSFCYGDNMQHVIYMPCEHKATANFELSEVAWAVSKAAEKSRMVVQNAAFEYVLSWHTMGLELPTPEDTAIYASHVDENESTGLKGLSKRWLNYHQATYRETLDKYGADDMRQLTGLQVLNYGCDDSLVTAHLYDLFRLITSLEGTSDFIQQRDCEFVHEQARAFIAGVTVDLDVIAALREKNEKLVEESTAKMKALLLEHCSDYNAEGAETLYNDLMAFEEAKIRANAEEGEDVEPQIEAKRDTLWEKISEGSRYVPYQEVVEEAPEWRPTPKKLNEVIKAVGLPPLEKLTKQAITKWVAEAHETVSNEVWQDQQADGVTEKAYQFLELFGAASHQLKTREGDEYQNFIDFCLDIVGQPKGRVTEVGDKLDLGSYQQVQLLLYAKLGLPIRVRSKVNRDSARDQLNMHGSPSTDAEAIASAMANDVERGSWKAEVLDALSVISKASTQLSMFLRPMPLWQHPEDGKIHPNLRNCGTVTRRPSCNNPNFLFLTKKDGGDLRNFVKPYDDDYVLISVDFNGQELRITASESKDPAMLDAYIGEHRKDIHSVTGASITPPFFNRYQFRDDFGLGPEFENCGEIEYDEFRLALKDPDLHTAIDTIRKSAKTVNFLLTYMGGYTTLARRLLIPNELAKELMEQSFARYSRLRPWQQETIEFARIHGYTQTAFGTRRHLGRELFSSDDGVRMRMERQAVNFTIQGCAADILKVVMSEAHRTKLFEDTGAILIAPVYDELASTVPRAAAWEYCNRLRDIMNLTPPGHLIPMEAEFSVSSGGWGSLIELGGEFTEDQLNEALDK